jgi:hypothetical protein
MILRFSKIGSLMIAIVLLGLTWRAEIARGAAEAAINVSPKHQPGAIEEPETWAFEPAPDDFSSKALLDLRYLNEKSAGQSGFLSVGPDGHFRTGDGKPIRLWAVGTDAGREKPFKPKPLGRKTEPDLKRHARFLAKRGVNMVRCHGDINPDPSQAPMSINEATRDWIWRTVAAMKPEGIYTTISPYWAVPAKFGKEWGIPGGAGQSALGLLFFDEILQGFYKEWLRKLFSDKNPYSGIPLAADPGVGIISLQNEDSLLFWTVNGIQAEQRKRLGKKFGVWLAKKYGSIEAAYTAWQNDSLPGDDKANGILDFHNVWEMTQERQGGRAKRLADQLEFWTRTMFDFNRSMETFLREELRCKQLINAGNWRTADTSRMNDAERWSYTANEVLAVNRYFGGLHEGDNNGWAIVKGQMFTSPSILREPLKFPLNLKRVRGFPMIVTESSWVMPDAYSSEGPFLVSVYQSLTGVDAFYWFSTGDDEWTPPQSANGYMPSQAKWLFGNPDMLGGFPAAAWLYRSGIVEQGKPVVSERRALEDIWERRPAIIAEESGFDPNRDNGGIAVASSVKRIVNPLAFLAGPVEVIYGGDPAKSTTADISGLVDLEKKVVRSVTGEITLDYGKGVCRLNAPKGQGIAAFFKEAGGKFSTGDLEISCSNDYGTLLAVAMDDKPLKTSGKILVQAGTQCRPTGWKQSSAVLSTKESRQEGFKVDDVGHSPWQVISPKMVITVQNTYLNQATVLDPNGNAVRTIPISKVSNGLHFEFPRDALYVMLQ